MSSAISTREIVLKVGAEGGSLTILRETDPHKNRRFWIEINETALYDLLSEEDRVETGDYFSKTGRVQSFQEALHLLDRYPWFQLHPLMVHPEFLNAVLSEVKKRGGADAEGYWREQLKHRAG